MHSENLIAKFPCHVLNHFLGPSIFENLFVHRNNILLFEGKAGDTVFTLFNSTLTVDVRFKIFLKLLLIIQVIFLSLVKK